jgi:hypothetical protein
MKKLFAFFILFSQLACNSGNSVDFKVLLKPQKTYDRVHIQTIEKEIRYTGDSNFMQRLKDKGITNPTKTVKTNTIEILIKTGNQSLVNKFPVIMEILSVSDTNNLKYLPKGSKIYGSSTGGNLPVLDSICSNGTNNEIKNQLVKGMQNLFSQVSFPEKIVQIGDTFSKVLPLSLSLAGKTLSMDIKTTYELTGIHMGIASFEIFQTYTMKSTNDDTSHTTTGTGFGDGHLLYDIANNYYTKYQINMNIKAHGNRKDYSFDYSTKSSLIQTSKITPNQ